MTRLEQHADTRARILDAAVAVLFEEGYAATSTLRIQNRVGLSRGGLLHQFPSRDALLVAAVSHLTSARVAALAIEQDWPDSLPERVDAAVDAMWLQYRQPYFWVSLELWLAARHNASIATELRPRERELGSLIRMTTRSFFGEALAARPSYELLAELLMTSMRGVGIAYALVSDRDPSTDPHLGLWKAFARHQLLDQPLLAR